MTDRKDRTNRSRNIDNFNFFDVLAGMSFKVELYPGAGHNYQLIIDAVHNYYKNKKTDKNLYFEDTLIWVAEDVNQYMQLKNVLDFVSYELYCENKGTAQFKINSTAILKMLKSGVEKNHSKIEEEKPAYKSWYDHYISYLKIEYGVKI